jgi:hypothetical protein
VTWYARMKSITASEGIANRAKTLLFSLYSKKHVGCGMLSLSNNVNAQIKKKLCMCLLGYPVFCLMRNT